MTQWFKTLPSVEQETVTRGWGTEKFASWTASFLLNGGIIAISSRLPPEERDRFARLRAQRSMIQRHPGHKPDYLERLYQQLHATVASIVQGIDGQTGHHGEQAVKWLDLRISSVQRSMHELYDEWTSKD